METIPASLALRGLFSQKGGDAELWSFRRSAPAQTVEQTIETPVAWDAMALIITSLECETNDILAAIFLLNRRVESMRTNAYFRIVSFPLERYKCNFFKLEHRRPIKKSG